MSNARRRLTKPPAPRAALRGPELGSDTERTPLSEDRRGGAGASGQAPPGPAHPQAAVVQLHPGLLSLLLLQELVGLHAALAGLLRLGPGEAHLGQGTRWAQARTLPGLLSQLCPGGPEDPTSGAFPDTRLLTPRDPVLLCDLPTRQGAACPAPSMSAPKGHSAPFSYEKHPGPLQCLPKNPPLAPHTLAATAADT